MKLCWLRFVRITISPQPKYLGYDINESYLLSLIKTKFYFFGNPELTLTTIGTSQVRFNSTSKPVTCPSCGSRSASGAAKNGSPLRRCGSTESHHCLARHYGCRVRLQRRQSNQSTRRALAPQCR